MIFELTVEAVFSQSIYKKRKEKKMLFHAAFLISSILIALYSTEQNVFESYLEKPLCIFNISMQQPQRNPPATGPT